MRASHPRSGSLHEYAPLLALIGLLLGIHAAQTAGSPNWDDAFMVVPAQIVASWQQLLSGAFDAGDAFTLGTLFTSALLHGDIAHVLYNCLFLWIFAGLVLSELGPRWLFSIFAITAVTGSLFHTFLNAAHSIPMLGASGAVMGFEGAYLGLALRRHLPDPEIWPLAHPIPPLQLVAFAVLGLIFDFAGLMELGDSGIAYGAHIGGFIGGLFLTSFVTPSDSRR